MLTKLYRQIKRQIAHSFHQVTRVFLLVYGAMFLSRDSPEGMGMENDVGFSALASADSV